ncbi:hypothetical protein LCGC14_2833970, partial [marine sediment metagenome]
SDVETTDKQRETALQSQVLIVEILEIMTKVGRKWKYKAIDNRNNRFILQTSIEPRDLPVTFKVGKKYILPVIMNKVGKVGNLDEKHIELIEDYTEGLTSTVPPEEQGGGKEQIDKITENDKAYHEQAQQLKEYADKPINDRNKKKNDLLDKLPKPPANDKPKSVGQHPTAIEPEGSQLVVEYVEGSDRNPIKTEVFEGEIIKPPASLLAYLPPIKEVKAYFDYIQEFKKSILDKKDIQVIGKNTHICRSGWEKFVNVFRLDHWIVSTKKEITRQHLQSFKWEKSVQPWIKIPDRDEWLDGIQYTVVVAMKSLTGSVTQGIGLVQQYEGGRDDRKEHDILAHAETRAFNRACSKIIGLGEVSAEEVQ